MSVLPDTELAQIEFCENHIAVWTANAVAIGLTSTLVTGLDDLTKAARAAYNAALLARQASKSATANFHNKTQDMRADAANLISLIKTKAETTNNPTIYATAQIPAPSSPAPKPVPAPPDSFTVSLESDGSLTLRWKCRVIGGATGVFYQVQRKLAGENSYRNIGGAPTRTFNDATVPAGIATVNYIVTGYRGTRAGEASESLTVQFGVGGGGLSVTGGELKMAA